MPRVKNIAWKFVIRLEGEKWRCPYCEAEYSGKVTRVKSHFLEHPNKGISPCKKVPEPIRELMHSLLNNQVRNKEDIAWKFVNRLGDGKWRCHYCIKEFFGDLTGVKGHLLKARNEGTCTGVPDPVRKLMRSLLDEVAEEESREANGQSSTEPQSRHMPTQADVMAEEESREANGQFSMEPQTRDMLTQAEGAEEESREPHNEFSTEPPSRDMSPLAEVAEQESREANNQFSTELLTPEFLELIESLEMADGITSDSPIFSPDFSILSRSLAENLIEYRHVNANTSEEIQMNELDDQTMGSSLQNDSSLDVDHTNRSQDCSQAGVAEVVPVLSNISLANTLPNPDQLHPRCEKEYGNDARSFASQTPVGGDPSIASQLGTDSPIIEAIDLPVAELATNTTGPSSSQASVPSQRESVPHQSINLKIMHQNPTIPSSSGKNHLVTCDPQNPVDMDPHIPSSSQAPDNAPSPRQIPPCGAVLIGPSSLPGMNRFGPMTSHPNTGIDCEVIGALKRKFNGLYVKENNIKEELKYAASLHLKKPRMEVVNWLADVEKLKNDFLCTEAASEDCLPPPHQEVDVLMREAEDLLRHGYFPNGLFEPRETIDIKLSKGKMVGEAFQKNTTKILDFLVEKEVSRLGIYGMGGVGKTTIMKDIHDRLLKKANYGNVLWITVSQDFNMHKLQDDIWEALGLGTLQLKDMSKRAAILSDHLIKRGKSTIILDDVWEYFNLEDVGIPVGANGLKLVLTTRSLGVCCQMQCQEKIKIKPLPQEEASNLFMEELGLEVTLNLEIEAVVQSIIKKCAGLPLGVITMARSMRGVRDAFEWRDCLVKLNESDKGQTDMEKVLMKLEFSYDRLENHEVQQCFLSCALYPEDELIDKVELIEFFMDQGLIGGSALNSRQKQYDRGFTILNKLENVCLLEDHGRWMKMHDLIRDMALHIMNETSIVQPRKWLKRIPPEECWTDALEKVSLMKNFIKEFPLNMSPNCPKLSTLLLNHNFLSGAIPDFFFKQLWGLKVLNLSRCYLRELPRSISELVSLRALVLKKCRALRCIPYLGKLISLRKLDISGCDSLEALEGLGMLVNLRYLDLTGTSIKRLPKGTLGSLLNLQYLKVETIFDQKQIAGVVNGEDITQLEALETLKCSFEDVDDFNKCVRVIGKHYYVLNLNQEKSLFDVEVSDDARFARFGCPKRSVSDDAEFRNLKRSVDILGWSHAIVIVGGECTGIFILIPQNVQTLRVTRCNGKINLSGMSPLKYLETLYIGQWENLGVLCGGQDEEVINIHDSPAPTPTPLVFPSLRYLYICKCPKLKYLFGHGSNISLPNLQGIHISECEEMVGIIATVTSLPPHPPPAFPSLEKIYVSSCPKMKRVVESEWLPHFCSLKEIHAYYCGNLEEIIGGPPPYVAVEKISLISLDYICVGYCGKIKRVMEWRHHFPNPRSIRVYSCENMEEIIGGPPPYESVEEISLGWLNIDWCQNMRRLFPQEWLIHLRNLGWIYVERCKGMVEIISGAGQGQGGSIMTPVSNNPSSFQPSSISLPNLEWLCLQKLPQLKSICEVTITCDSLKFLRVNRCPELNRIPLQLQFSDIEQLPDIAVEDEEKWKSLIWDHPNPQAALQPYLHFNGSAWFLKRPKSPSHERELSI